MDIIRNLFFGLIIIGIAFMVAIDRAMPHSWYDAWCCNDSDCGPLKPEEVQVNADGYLIKGEFFIPHGSDQIKLSRDWDYHFCEYPKGQARCFYIPPGGS